MSDPKLSIETFVERNFGENALVLSTTDEAGKNVGWVIDPSFPPQSQRILEYANEHKIAIEKIVLTHGHGDHIAGVDVIHQAHPKAQLLMGLPDQPMLSDSNKNLSALFGADLTICKPVDADLAPSMEMYLGGLKWQVLDTSGHSPGGRSLYCQQAGLVIVGDALFAGSIGRTDFPGSDHNRLITNIRENLFTLPDETAVYSGHGPVTKIGKERKYNPFVSEE